VLLDHAAQDLLLACRQLELRAHLQDILRQELGRDSAAQVAAPFRERERLLRPLGEPEALDPREARRVERVPDPGGVERQHVGAGERAVPPGEELPDALQICWAVSIEAKDVSKPALVAEWLVRYYR